MRSLTDPGDPVTALLRADATDVRLARNAIVVLINPDLSQPHALTLSLDPLTQAAGAAFGGAVLVDGAGAPGDALAPGEVRIVRLARARDVMPRRREADDLRAAVKNPRIVIENVAPLIEAGRFAAKRIVGETVTVEADIFADGHDTLVAELLWRAEDEGDWRRMPMRLIDNDRWRGTFMPGRIGRHLFTIEAWSDEYRTLAREIEIKHAAGADLALEIAEMAALIDHALADAEDAALAATRRRIEGLAAGAGRRPAARACDQRGDGAAGRAPLSVAARAGAAARRSTARRPSSPPGTSCSRARRRDDPARHGTFDDVIARLPRDPRHGLRRALLPADPSDRPHQPQGPQQRADGRPGRSRQPLCDRRPPRAATTRSIPQLGTLDDFRAPACAAAREHGLEIALDFAIQCSPDHPWLQRASRTGSPGGPTARSATPRIRRRNTRTSSTSISTPTAPCPACGWRCATSCCSGSTQGVRIFRVDNPHTKPLPFWEWLIADVRARHPDVIFLAEAFTRPKMMYRLAKIGFSQSYTYFTWRNTKRELTDYLHRADAPAAAGFLPAAFLRQHAGHQSRLPADLGPRRVS